MTREPVRRWLVTANVTEWVGHDRLLARALDAFEAVPETTPQKFGPNEKRLQAYARKPALASKPKRPGEWYQQYVRSTPARIDANILTTESTTDVKLRLEGEDGKPVFDLADELAARISPRLVVAGPLLEPRDADDADAKEINLIIASLKIYEPNLRMNGPVGLAPRTCFGPEIVALIGRDKLEGLGLPLKSFPGGGVRIDLVPEPWAATPEELVKPWKKAMGALRKSGVFSTIKGMTSDGMPMARKGANWP